MYSFRNILASFTLLEVAILHASETIEALLYISKPIHMYLTVALNIKFSLRQLSATSDAAKQQGYFQMKCWSDINSNRLEWDW